MILLYELVPNNNGIFRILLYSLMVAKTIEATLLLRVEGYTVIISSPPMSIPKCAFMGTPTKQETFHGRVIGKHSSCGTK